MFLPLGFRKVLEVKLWMGRPELLDFLLPDPDVDGSLGGQVDEAWANGAVKRLVTVGRGLEFPLTLLNATDEEKKPLQSSKGPAAFGPLLSCQARSLHAISGHA